MRARPPRLSTRPLGLAAWRQLARRALREVDTPCFLFSAEALARQAAALERFGAGLPLRHWWSCKTLAIDPALTWWKNSGRPVEVVSEAEFVQARRLGFAVEDILLNGPAKHRWLPRHARPGLRVNFDSLAEIEALLPLAKRLRWRLGVRFNTATEVHAEHPGVRTQFGLLPAELPAAARLLARAGGEVEVVHFHVRTQVDRAEVYAEALREVLAAAAAVGWKPTVLDLGGGWPTARVRDLQGRSFDAGFSKAALRRVLRAVPQLPGGEAVRELWMENGRWLTAPLGVLAIRVLDLKENRGDGVRVVIADGGRTLHAMVATWERHRVVPLRAVSGPRVRTLVCGPTCMAFDNLGVHSLPRGLRAGDVLLWLEAGAYQTPWETRFSHGLAAQVWISEDRGVRVVRSAEGKER